MTDAKTDYTTVSGDKDEEKKGDEIKLDELTPQQQLFHYARSGDVDGIRVLAKVPQFSPDAVDDGTAKPGAYDSQNTAMHYACQYGHLSVVKLLDELQADVNKANKIGSTPLHVAASHGHVNIIEYLLKIKANLEAKNKIGNHPLHCAIYSGHVAATIMLLAGYDDPKNALQAQNYIGMVPPRYAASNDMKDAITDAIKKYFPNGQTQNSNSSPPKSDQNKNEIAIQIYNNEKPIVEEAKE